MIEEIFMAFGIVIFPIAQILMAIHFELQDKLIRQRRKQIHREIKKIRNLWSSPIDVVAKKIMDDMNWNKDPYDKR